MNIPQPTTQLREDDPKSMKILVVGAPKVGKTSLCRRFTRNSWSNEPVVTLGVDFSMKVIDRRYLDSEHSAKVQLWDIAGQEFQSSMVRSYYKGAHAVMVVVDGSDASSFEAANGWKAEIERRMDELNAILPDGGGSRRNSLSAPAAHLSAQALKVPGRSGGSAKSSLATTNSTGGLTMTEGTSSSGSPSSTVDFPSQNASLGQTAAAGGGRGAKNDEEPMRIPVVLVVMKSDLKLTVHTERMTPLPLRGGSVAGRQGTADERGDRGSASPSSGTSNTLLSPQYSSSLSYSMQATSTYSGATTTADFLAGASSEYSQHSTLGGGSSTHSVPPSQIPLSTSQPTHRQRSSSVNVVNYSEAYVADDDVNNYVQVEGYDDWFSVSAKTGDGVDAAFESMARKVQMAFPGILDDWTNSSSRCCNEQKSSTSLRSGNPKRNSKRKSSGTKDGDCPC